MLVSAVSKRTRERKIAAAMASGAASRVLSSLLTLVSLPLAVRYLGAERFGVWATITSTVVFLNLLDLGIASTLTNHIARAYAAGDRDYAARYTANALAVTVSVACAAGLALIAAWPYIDWMALFNVSASVTRREVSGTVAVAAILMLLGLPASLGSSSRGLPASSSQQSSSCCRHSREPGRPRYWHRIAGVDAGALLDVGGMRHRL